jgi:hypothetical protein
MLASSEGMEINMWRDTDATANLAVKNAINLRPDEQC